MEKKSARKNNRKILEHNRLKPSVINMTLFTIVWYQGGYYLWLHVVSRCQILYAHAGAYRLEVISAWAYRGSGNARLIYMLANSMISKCLASKLTLFDQVGQKLSSYKMG